MTTDGILGSLRSAKQLFTKRARALLVNAGLATGALASIFNSPASTPSKAQFELSTAPAPYATVVTPEQSEPAFGASQTRGEREHQEDRYVYGPTGLKTAQQASAFLAHHFQAFQDQEQVKNAPCGTTASVAVVTPDGMVTIASAGDSPMLAVYQDQKTGAMRAMSLNELHRNGSANPEAPPEAITRDLGGWKLAHHPDIKTFGPDHLARSENERIFLVNTSDGVMEHYDGTPEDLARFLEENIRPGASAIEIAEFLAPKSNQVGDNKTALVMELPQEWPKTGWQLTVADGHGGSAEVAEGFQKYIGKAFAGTQSVEYKTDPLIGFVEQKIHQHDKDGIHGPENGHWYVQTDKKTGVGINGNEVVVFNSNGEDAAAISDLFREQGIQTAVQRLGLAVSPDSMVKFNAVVSEYILTNAPSKAKRGRAPQDQIVIG